MIWLIIFVFVALAVIVYFTVKHARRQSSAAVNDSVNRAFYKHVIGINQKNADGTSRQDIINGCHKSEELVLVSEPGNYHEPGAVKICRMNGEQIGYLPTDGGRMAHDLETGWTFRTTIDDIYPFDENPRKHGVLLHFEIVSTSPGFEAGARRNSNSC